MSLGTVKQLVDYFNINRHIFQKQRSTKQHMQRVMSMLSQQNMEILQKQFELYPKGLELPTFIYLMKKLYTPENQINKYYFVSDLIKFFQAIDINGDGHLEWSEFTQYIIENIRRIEKPNYKNKQFQQNQVISSAYSKISNQYKIVNVIDTGALNPIKKIVYVSKQQKYYLLQTGSNLIRIYDDKFTLVDFLEIKTETQYSYIVDFSFDKNNVILGALFQSAIRFCNLKVLGNVKTCNECEAKKMAQYHKAQYLNLHKLWAFLSKTGQLKLCSAVYRSRTALQFSVVTYIRQHQSLITDICEIQEPLYIATCSMDGNVKFYSQLLKKSMTLQHISQQTTSAIDSKYKKGILGLDYTRQFGSYILTFGFCSSIYIYSLDISMVKGFTGKYKQHAGNLITAKFLKSFPYVLSFDDKLNMRIWDFRHLQTIQIINCQKNFINPSRLEIIPELSQCLVCEKKITQFRAPSLQKKSKEINEFHIIFDFKICAVTNKIFLFTSNDVRVYNYITGSLQKVFTKLSQGNYQTNITACQFGYKGRKFFVGDAGGFVREYCSQTGQFLQQIQPGQDNQYENKSVVRIIFLKEHSMLIVCTLDGRIMIYERDSQSQFQIIRDMRETHFELTCAQASSRYCTLATGSEDGVVNIWNLQKLSLQGVLVLPTRVLNIAFSPIHPIMMVTQQSGTISFFYVRPYPQTTLRNKCFVKIINTDSFNNRKPITSIGFQLIINAYLKRESQLVKDSCQKSHLICLLGNKNGSVEMVNVSSVLSRFRVEQNHQIFNIKKSVKSQILSLRTTIANQKKKVLSLGFSNESAPQLLLSQFTQRITFNAHNSTVDRLLLVKQSGVILSTSSFDKKVKLWNMQGQLNGSIDFFTFKKVTWKVAEMNFYKKLQAIDTTIYSVKLIQNKQLSIQEQEFIKINMLINEYMSAEEKEQYLRWLTLLKRSRSRAATRKKPTRKIVQAADQPDAKDQVQDFGNVNNIGQSVDQFCPNTDVQFQQIYSKLVAKIKTKLDRPQLPLIPSKKQHKQQQSINARAKEIHLSDFMASLRRTLKGNQEEERKIQKEFTSVMNRKVKNSRKGGANMLYQSLVEVRKNIEALERKNHYKSKKIL